jgi:hypothetical protein
LRRQRHKQPLHLPEPTACGVHAAAVEYLQITCQCHECIGVLEHNPFALVHVASYSFHRRPAPRHSKRPGKLDIVGKRFLRIRAGNIDSRLGANALLHP